VDFQRVQRSGRRVRLRTLVVVYARGTSAAIRIGLAVGRRVGGAVVRNRVKRWIREAARAVGPPAGGPWDLVVIAEPGAAESSLVAIRGELDAAFRRVRP
jgi:ribonuclease P protein component